MIVHNFDPILVDFGIFQIRWYSMAYILGILLGWLYANLIIKKSSLNKYNFHTINKKDFEDLLIYLIVGIIIGGRLGYVLFYNLEYFTSNLFEILKIWNGGMSFHGGLVGVIVSILIFSKKYNFGFFKFADIIACVSPIGIFLGRLANFINGELYGKVSSMPWAVIFPDAGNLPRHPSQIYEALLEGVVLFILINFLALKKNLLYKPGNISALFLISYSILRIISEIFREPDEHLGYLFNYFSVGSLLSFLTLISGFIILFYIKKNEQNN